MASGDLAHLRTEDYISPCFEPQVYYGTLARMSELLPGVAATAAMGWLTYTSYFIPGFGYGFFMTAFGYPLIALAFALLVVAALSPGSWLARV